MLLACLTTPSLLKNEDREQVARDLSENFY